MEFNVLATIANECNNGRYKEAVKIIKQQERNILPREACFIANGMNIRYLKEVVDLFPDVRHIEDFRGKLRIEMAKEIKKEENGNKTY